MRAVTVDGAPLVPGHNVDRVDVAAGIAMARKLGYATDGNETFVVEYALMRHRRGEEDGAQKTALHGGVDLTSWFAILAAAVATAEAAHESAVRAATYAGSEAT